MFLKIIFSSHYSSYTILLNSFLCVTLLYTSSENWINKLSIDVWFVMIRQYLAEMQLFENLRVQKTKSS